MGEEGKKDRLVALKRRRKEEKEEKREKREKREREFALGGFRWINNCLHSRLLWWLFAYLELAVTSCTSEGNNDTPELDWRNGVFEQNGPNNKKRNGLKVTENLVGDRRSLPDDDQNGEVNNDTQNTRGNHKKGLGGGQPTDEEGVQIIHVGGDKDEHGGGGTGGEVEKLERRESLLLQSAREDLDAGNTGNSHASPKQPIQSNGNIMDSGNSNTKDNNNQSSGDLHIGGVSPAEEGFGKDNNGDDGKLGHLVDTNGIVLEVCVTADNGESLKGEDW